MKALLDTHAVLWWLLDDPRLSRVAHDLMSNPDNDLVFSAVSGYEILHKHSLGKLPRAIDQALEASLIEAQWRHLPISIAHAIEAARLPGPHRDPWDRLLMAQSRSENLPLISSDPIFADYGVQTLW